MFRTVWTRAAVHTSALLLSLSAVHAQAPADYYRGKTMRMIIGYRPGGGYDLYGRVVAQFLPKQLPGNPTAVVQNIPGAGSFVRQNTCMSWRPGLARISLAELRG